MGLGNGIRKWDWKMGSTARRPCRLHNLISLIVYTVVSNILLSWSANMTN